MKVRYYLFIVTFLLYSNYSNAQNSFDNIGLTSGTPASVAFSLRQLSTTYTGPLVRIKVGTSFYDVYPDLSAKKFSLNSKISASLGTYNAAVSVASANALSTIITGSTDATVAIWYDQSGNSVNVLSSSATAKIITSGSINTINNQPTIYFNGSTSYLVSSSTVNYSSQTSATINTVAQNVASTDYISGIISTGSSGGWGLSYDPTSTIKGYWIDASGGNGASSNENTTEAKIITGLMGTSTNSSIYINSVLKGTKVAQPIANGTANNIIVGRRGSDIVSRQFIGNISEIFMSPKNLSSAEQATLETSQSIFLPPSVTITSSASGYICSGTQVTFTANIQNFTSTPSYQWYKNSVAITGATSSTYTTTTLANNDAIYASTTATSLGTIASSGLLFNLDAGNSSSYSGSGSTWNDISGNNNNTPLYNTPTYSSSNGGSLIFNGTNQYGQTPNTVDNFAQGTFITWIKRNGDQSQNTLKGLIFTRQGAAIGLDLKNNCVGYTWNDFDWPDNTNTLLVPDNTWCMVAISVNPKVSTSNSTANAYLFTPSGMSTESVSKYHNVYSSLKFKIGDDDCCGVGVRMFNGNIGQVLTYNTALTTDQIKSIYNVNASRFGLTPFGTTISSNTITSTVNPLPTVNITLAGDACLNKTILSTTNGLSSYLWYKDNVAIGGAISSTYIPVLAGDYQVQVSNGICSNTSSSTTIYTCGVSADGKMSSLLNTNFLLSNEGGNNFGTAIDNAGSIKNATTLTTTSSTIGATTAILGGVISPTNATTSSIGLIYSTNINFSTYSSSIIQSNVAAGSYTTTISALSPLTTYYAKAFIVNKAGTSYGPFVSITTTSPPISVGDSYGGGIVYYILQSGDNGYDVNVQHGLIAAETNQTVNARTWNKLALNGNAISGAQNSGTLVGKANTAAIIANQGTISTYLFKYVNDNPIGAYSDWYVPSKKEIQLFQAYLHTNTTLVGGIITNRYTNDATTGDTYYWRNKLNLSNKYAWGHYFSSTQNSDNTYVGCYMETFGQFNNWPYSRVQDGNFTYVAIRSF